MVDPDVALIDASGRGDWSAFESLVRRYQYPLLSFTFRYLGDRATAEDVTQEVFLRIYRAAPRFEAKTKVSTWIFHIAYNVVLTEMARRSRQEDLCEAVSQSREDPYQEPLYEPSESFELQEEIRSALAELPGHQRAALLLRINDDLSYREIGEVLGVGVQSVESLLFRARKNLKLILGKMKISGVRK